jgi:hypothetical protein
VAGQSWTKLVVDERTNQTLLMRKMAFQMPSTTHEGRLFAAMLVHWPTRTQLSLGGLSIVSHQSQRDKRHRRIERRFPAAEHRQLLLNFECHPSTDRHAHNNKGGRQNSVKYPEGLFRPYELERAVCMHFAPL